MQIHQQSLSVVDLEYASVPPQARGYTCALTSLNGNGK